MNDWSNSSSTSTHKEYELAVALLTGEISTEGLFLADSSQEKETSGDSSTKE